MAGYDVSCPLCGGYCELVETTQQGDGLKLVFKCASCQVVWADQYCFPCVRHSIHAVVEKELRE